MRLAILAAFSLLALALVAPTASAVPFVCVERGVDDPPVIVTVEYGIGCVHARVAYCTLEHSTEYPSYPWWECHDVVNV